MAELWLDQGRDRGRNLRSHLLAERVYRFLENDGIEIDLIGVYGRE